jgi:hypothetical protein
VAVVVAILANLVEFATPIRANLADLERGTAWLRAHAPPDATVMTQDPRPRYLYLRRKTVDYPGTRDMFGLEEYVRRRGVDYVLVAPNLRLPPGAGLAPEVESFFLPAFESAPATFAPITAAADGDVRLYQVLPGEG